MADIKGPRLVCMTNKLETTKNFPIPFYELKMELQMALIRMFVGLFNAPKDK